MYQKCMLTSIHQNSIFILCNDYFSYIGNISAQYLEHELLPSEEKLNSALDREIGLFIVIILYGAVIQKLQISDDVDE